MTTALTSQLFSTSLELHRWIAFLRNIREQREKCDCGRDKNGKGRWRAGNRKVGDKRAKEKRWASRRWPEIWKKWSEKEGRKERGTKERRKIDSERDFLGVVVNCSVVKGLCLNLSFVYQTHLSMTSSRLIFIEPFDCRRNGTCLCFCELSWEERKELVYSGVSLSEMNECSEVIQRKL